MIKFFQIDDILDNKKVSFSESKKELSLEEIENLKRVRLFDFQLSASSYVDDNKVFLRTMLINLVEKFRVHLYLTEKTAKRKSKSRSFKKLLYPYKNNLLSSNIFEEEVSVDEDKTLIYSVVELSIDNFQFVIDNLTDSKLAFIRIDTRNLEKVDLSISRLIQKTPLKKGDLFDFNKLKLLDFIVSDHSSVMNSYMDGLDNYHLRFFFQSQSHSEYVRDLSSIFWIKEVNI
jgi:hypothetical protein